MEELAKNLLLLRAAKKATRDTVSKAVGISAKSYERYEKNERNPDALILVRLADYYGVTLDQLTGRAPLPEDIL